MPSRVCLDPRLAEAGKAARKAAPPVVAASSIGSWQWCPLKAWHSTTLFNAGWLGRPEGVVAEGLAMLWAAELAKKTIYSIIHGRIIHGEAVEPGDAVAAAEAAKRLATDGARALEEMLGSGLLASTGLIEPAVFGEQLRRYHEAEDLEEYSRREDWPMVARRSPQGFYVIGVPDRVERTRGGYRVEELKTTMKPWLARRRGRSYRAALAQLAAYAWILVERWPLEEAVLIFKDAAGKTIIRETFEPTQLAAMFEEQLLPVAERLAAPEPPGPPQRPPCRSCEYGGRWPLPRG